MRHNWYESCISHSVKIMNDWYVFMIPLQTTDINWILPSSYLKSREIILWLKNNHHFVFLDMATVFENRQNLTKNAKE